MPAALAVAAAERGRRRSRVDQSGALGRSGSGAAMSLSNKLTLDKVDVKGKRVVMR